jgi:hypothetical protein
MTGLAKLRLSPVIAVINHFPLSILGGHTLRNESDAH